MKSGWVLGTLAVLAIPLHADVRAKHADERWKSCIRHVMIGGSKPLHQNFSNYLVAEAKNERRRAEKMRLAEFRPEDMLVGARKNIERPQCTHGFVAL